MVIQRAVLVFGDRLKFSGCETEFFLLNGFCWDWAIVYIVG
jgi:hypothetical protein